MIGSTVGNYRIVEKIGEGGMGAVFRGVDLMLEREVAVKVLKPEFSSQPQLVERFRAEAVTLAKLNHPNVATLHNFFRQGNDFFMVMEFVRGETLESVIKQTGALSCARAVDLFNQAMEGIGRAHKLGIIHRDIKPANMMLTEDGSIKVMDFGIARMLGTSRVTKQGNIVGTIAYMSPEAIQGAESDGRSDIYSLGILLYEMVTGRGPFDCDTEFSLMMAQIQDPPPPPTTFVPTLPLHVERAIMKALAKNPEARFQSVGEFSSALGRGPVSAETEPQSAPSRSAPTGARERPGTALPVVEQLKQTRLAAVESGPSSGVKQTRLGEPGYSQPFASGGSPYHAPDLYTPAATRVSLFARLNWKHYAAAAVVLFMLLAVPFIAVVLLSVKPAEVKDPASSQRPAMTQPSAGTDAGGAAKGTGLPDPGPGDLKQSDAGVSPAGGPTPIDAGPKTPDETRTARKAADAAARERARRRAEAKRLLSQ
jgi:serine/threonine-protein kinase